METEITHLQLGLTELRADMKTALGYLSVLPQKRDLDAWKFQWMCISVGAVALIVGGIIGGLALLAMVLKP